MSDELAIEGQNLVGQVTALAVVDDPTFQRAGVMLKTVKLYLRRVAEVFDPIVETAFLAHKTAVAQRKSVEQYALTAERTLKDRMGTYEQEQAAIRREAERIAEVERQRLEAEERTRVAVEEARLQAEAEERRLAEAVAAEQAGDRVRAQALIEAPVVVAPVAPRPVFVAPPPVARPAVEGVSFRDDWDFEVQDAARIPREYLMVNEVQIRKVVKAMKGQTAIPGIRAFARRVTAARL